jgi:pimeloyl-ACP methyl ester carboxylesterase
LSGRSCTMASSRSRAAEVVGDLSLSGRIALPDGSPRALLVALHGHGMTSRYFDAPADADLSLLELGADLGFAVWAPDRPGYGGSVGADPALFAMSRQAALLEDAVVAFRERYGITALCLLVGHSFGMKLALAMASRPQRFPLLGIDGSGCGLRYAFEPGVSPPVARPRDVSPSWGPRDSYPSGTFDRALLPTTRIAPPPEGETEVWPEVFRGFADRVVVPVRITFGEHDRLWVVDEVHSDELRGILAASRRVEVGIQRGAGHNISLSRVARAYHLKVMAFAEECLASHTATESVP